MYGIQISRPHPLSVASLNMKFTPRTQVIKEREEIHQKSRLSSSSTCISSSISPSKLSPTAEPPSDKLIHFMKQWLDQLSSNHLNQQSSILQKSKRTNPLLPHPSLLPKSVCQRMNKLIAVHLLRIGENTRKFMSCVYHYVLVSYPSLFFQYIYSTLCSIKALVAVWEHWLKVKKIILSKTPKDGMKVIVPDPLLPWYAPLDVLAAVQVKVLWLNYCPERLNNALKGDHAAGSYRSDGSLKSECWQMKLESLGAGLYSLCIKINAIAYLIPYGGKKTDVFFQRDVDDIDAAYAEFTRYIMHIPQLKHLLGSHKVEEWVVNSFGNKTIFYQFVEENLSQFYVASEDRVACCHPEVPLNTRRHNSYLPGHCGDWDYVHTDAKVEHYGFVARCTVAMDICNGIGDSVAFQLMEASAKELHERNRQLQLALVKAGNHPFQQKEHKEATKKRLLALARDGKHPWQQDEHKEATKKRQLALAKDGNHSMQRLSAAGNNPMQRPEVVAKAKASRLAGTAKKQKRTVCNHEGCTKWVVNNGLCVNHGATKPKQKTCSHEGCTKQSQKGGFCSRHDPNRRRCSHEGCSCIAQEGREFCGKHY